MNEVNYLCCPGCHGWYRDGSKHTCDFSQDGTLLWGNPGVSDDTEDDDIRIPEKPPVAVHQLINSERMYALLERIATALEKLVEK